MTTFPELLPADAVRDVIAGDLDGPLFCIRPAVIAANARRLQQAFAGVIAYDVRTNPHPAVLEALRGAGVRAFAACSVREAAMVAPDDELLFRNPYASNATLREVVRLHPSARFVVDGLDTLERVRAAGARAVSVDAVQLTKAAADAGLDAGVSIQPGALAADLCGPIDLGLTAAGAPPSSIDEAEALCRALSGEARRLGIAPSRLRLTPAAALVGAACSVVTRVLLRKGDRLYLDEGRFGWFYILGRDSWRDLPPLPVRAYRLQGGLEETPIARFRAFGPTCDSYDELTMPLLLPDGIAEGDFVEVEGIGADSVLCATHFNGFYSSRYAVLGERSVS